MTKPSYKRSSRKEARNHPNARCKPVGDGMLERKKHLALYNRMVEATTGQGGSFHPTTIQTTKLHYFNTQ
jgi:hypothetical protein